MGYYSRFEIEQKNTNIDYEVIAKKLEKVSGGYTFNEWNGVLYSDDNYKWYDYQKDMKKLSSLYPETIFKVHREGEEAGDIEDTYYKNGKLVSTVTLDAKLPEPDFSQFVIAKPAKIVKAEVVKGRKFRESNG